MPTLFSVFNDAHKDRQFDKIDFAVQQKHGKSGLVYSPARRLVIPYEYDNIFRYGMKVFALCKNGKWGAVRFFDDAITWVAPCEYDTMDTLGHDLIFSKAGEQRYYFYGTHIVRDFNEIVILSPYGTCVFAVDENAYYVLKTETGRELWTCSKHDERLRFADSAYGKPCLAYLGEKNGLPIFFDCTSANYVVPDGEDKLTFARHAPNMIMPVIVNGKHIVTLVDGAGVNVGDFDECFNKGIHDHAGFDEATVEIRVTLKGKNRTEERCYPIPGGTVVSGEVRELETWKLPED